MHQATMDIPAYQIRLKNSQDGFWSNHEDAEYISAKLGIDTKKLNRILTLEQLPDEELLMRMMELCK